jgi:hypothetical protein
MAQFGKPSQVKVGWHRNEWLPLVRGGPGGILIYRQREAPHESTRRADCTRRLLRHSLLHREGPGQIEDFDVRILGGKVIKPDNPCYIKLANTWIILNSGGGPTPDKPEALLETPSDLKE